MSSSVDICNLALVRIGMKPIASLTEASETARKCNAIYDDVRKTVLRDHPWNFATKIKPLAESSDDTVIGWMYVYGYESDCLFLRRVFNEGTEKGKSEEFTDLLSDSGDYKIIACNIKPAYAEYTVNITNTDLFDGSFISAFAFNLASELALSLTGSGSKSTEMLQKYELARDRATTLNSSEKHQEKSNTSSYESAR